MASLPLRPTRVPVGRKSGQGQSRSRPCACSSPLVDPRHVVVRLGQPQHFVCVVNPTKLAQKRGLVAQLVYSPSPACPALRAASASKQSGVLVQTAGRTRVNVLQGPTHSRSASAVRPCCHACRAAAIICCQRGASHAGPEAPGCEAAESLTSTASNIPATLALTLKLDRIPIGPPSRTGILAFPSAASGPRCRRDKCTTPSEVLAAPSPGCCAPARTPLGTTRLPVGLPPRRPRGPGFAPTTPTRTRPTSTWRGRVGSRTRRLRCPGRAS